MPDPLLLAADLVAITVLTFGVYFPRHRRRDLVVAFLGVNVGVLAVCAVLSSGTVGAGVGLGLFGVLSIIRLRSSELGQREVAYFSALALGLLGGLPVGPDWVSVALMALVLVVMAVGDHPRLLSRYRNRTLVLDRAFSDETALRVHLSGLLASVQQDVVLQEVDIHRIDLVNDTTLVEVRYRTRPIAGVPAEPALRAGVSR